MALAGRAWGELRLSTDVLSIPDIMGSDPLAHLFWRLRISPARLALIFFLAGVGYLFGLSAAFGYLWPSLVHLASGVDYFNQLNFLIIFPTIAYYYLWQPAAIEKVYLAIRRLTPDEVEPALWSRIRRINVHRGWWLAALLAALLGIVAGTIDNGSRMGLSWYTANSLMAAILEAFRGLIFYMLPMAAARHFAAALGFNQCYRHFQIPLTILPARHSGLRDVGRYALSFTVLVAVVGLNIGTAPLLSSQMGVDYPAQVVAYFLFAPAAFLLPLWQAHRYMERHRDRLLGDLAHQHQAEYARLFDDLRESGAGASASLERLKVLHETYELTRKATTWPISLELMSQLAATIVLPFLFIFLQVLLNRFVK